MLWLPRSWWKRLFARFEIQFTAFSVLFLKHWRLFYVNWRYICQNTGENIYLLALITGFRHFPFYFKNICVYFASIVGNVAKILAKMFICWLWNGFTVFSVLFLDHWRIFCVDWRYFCQDMGQNFYSPALKLGLRHLLFYF